MAKQIHQSSKPTNARLPTNVRPSHYDLWLKPDLTNFTFAGKVGIAFEAVKPEKTILLNAQQLTIQEGSIGSSQLVSVTYNDLAETALLEFQNEIPPQGVLNLSFTGCLNDKMKGFYRTTFQIDGTTVNAATTQFEPTDARKCFPCWDEPAIKASFSVKLVVEKYLTINGKQYERTVLSNMPEASRAGPDSEVEVAFEKSPIMSTYLLAFVVAPLEYLETHDGKRPIRVYTTPGKKEQGQFALDVASKSLSFYEDYFNIKFPLPKMDMIAIPDFMSGAMENWGLVTYRETALLYDPKNTSTDRKQWVALVVAHELAHQWFGNLVTMEWWTHLWLNEGFATFMEYHCVDKILPEFDIWSQFVSSEYNQALDLDSLHNSHPIEVPVKFSAEVDEIFDSISYSKGASVIRMLYAFIGDDAFRKGMADYLTRFAYKNTLTEDLWDCLGRASNKPVAKLMSGWTGQKGYPWLAVSYEKDGDRAKLYVKQNKFSADGTVPEEDAKCLWMIPIDAITGKSPNQRQEVALLEGESGELVIDGVGDGWVKLNSGTIGLYRVAYPQEMIEKLWPAISSKTLPPMDRLGLQDEFYALCQAGHVSSVDLLKLLQAFKGENVYTVWSSINACVGRIATIMSYTDLKVKFDSFARELFGDVFKRVTWFPQGDEHSNDALLRSLVLNRLVASGEKSVIDEALKRFGDHLAGTPLAADLRGAVYRAVSTHGDDKMFNDLIGIFRTAELHEEKNRVLRAIGFAANNDARLQTVLDLMLSDEVRNQDKIFPLMAIGAVNQQAAWKFFKDNKDMLKEKFDGGHLIVSFVKAATKNFASEEMAQDVLKFFEENQFSNVDRVTQQSVETIRLNAAWLQRDRKAIEEYLASF